MALRDQPYLPLFVQDIMTDEKLNECSPATHGIYIKGIMCLMHKSEDYGKILLKQNYKQNESKSLNFGYQLTKHLPYSPEQIKNAIDELINERVCYFDGDYLCQKRMIHDNLVSEARSIAAKKGGGNPNFVKTKRLTKPQTNTEYENEYENEIKTTSSLQIKGPKINFSDLENSQWFEAILRYLQFKISLDELMTFWKQFQEGMIADDDLYREKEDYRSHFRNWVKIQIENNDKKNRRTNGFNSPETSEAIEQTERIFAEYGQGNAYTYPNGD